MLKNHRNNCTQKSLHSFCLCCSCVLLTLVSLSAATQAATYYVSVGGSDSNPGTQNSPWRNIDYAAQQVGPGDTVNVSGGVYYETVTSRTNGTASQRITFKGDPGNPPVIDGTAKVTGWKQCTGPQDFLRPNGTSIGSLPGNSNYANIYKATVPVSDIGDPANVAIFEDGEYMFTSSFPIQTNNVFDDETTYKRMDSSCYGQRSYLNDSSLTQPDDFWNGATVKVWVLANNNTVSTRTVSDFVSSQGKIVFDSDLPANLSSSGMVPDAYALQNHWSLLNKKGTAYITRTPVNNAYTIYVWPTNANDLDNRITVSKRAAGVWLSSASYVTIDGFVIRGIGTTTSTTAQRSCGIGNAAGWTHTGLEIRNCTIKNSAGYGGISVWCGTDDIFENNMIENCRSGFGIAFQGRDYARNYNSIIRNNTVRRIRSTGLKIIYSSDIQITGNTASEFGSHGNGCSLYQFNENVLFAHNRITRSRNALTIKESENVTIYGNVLTGDGGNPDGNYILAAWSASSGTPMSGQVAILNNIILSEAGGTSSLFISNSPQTQAQWIIKNNIIDGFYWDDGISPVTSHNLWTKYSWKQKSSSYKPGTGESRYEVYDDIFSHYDAMDFTHAPQGYATNKGTGISAYLPTSVFSDYNFNVDIAGSPVNTANIADLGAYASASIAIPAPVAHAGSDQSIAFADRGRIQLNGSQSTGYGMLTYTWTLDGFPFALGVSPLISFLDKPAGIYTVTLTVQDGQTPPAVSSDTVRITVENENSSDPDKFTIRDGLVGYWQFSEGAGTDTVDISDYTNDASISSAAMWSDSGSLTFDSTDTYLTCKSTPSLNLTGSLSVAAWIKPQSFGGGNYGRILDKGDGPSGRGFSLMVNGNSRDIGYMAYGGVYVSSNDGLIDLNTWAHVCVVYDRASQVVRFFVNGQDAGSSSYARNPADNAGDALYIGLRGYDQNRHFDGQMDDVALYNRALTDSEVLQLYSKDSSDDSMTALWRLDDLSGSLAQDACENRYTATLLNNPEWGNPWKDGQEECLYFSGKRQALEINAGSLSADSGTLVLTAAPYSTSGIRFLFGHVNETATQNMIWLYTVSGKLTLGMGNNSTLSTNIETLKIGTMYHIALAWNGTTYFIYVDGQLKDSGIYEGLTDIGATADIANMGSEFHRTYELGFDGCIDEIRTYSRALSADEIAALTNRQETKQNKKMEFYITGEDPYGNPYSYTAQNLPEGAIYDATTQTFTWRPWYSQSGKHQVLFVSQDGADRQTLTVSAQDVDTRDWYHNFLSQNGKL